MLHRLRRRQEQQPYLLSNTQTSWLTKHDAPSADTPMTIRDEDAMLFEVFSRGRTFSVNCTCSVCAPGRYRCPGNCHLLHRPADLVIEDGDGPATNCTKHDAISRFEALHLVTVACHSFTRRPEKMSADQKDAIRQWRDKVDKGNLPKDVAAQDCRSVLTSARMKTVARLLTRIFLLDAVSLDTFEWSTTPTPDGGHARTERTMSETDQVTHMIHMHPTRVPPRVQVSMANLRIGVLLHELIHAFLGGLTCRYCMTAYENVGSGKNGHGRAWLLLATAIQKEAPKILGLSGEPCLGRLIALEDYWLGNGAPDDASLHDLQRYGFRGSANTARRRGSLDSGTRGLHIEVVGEKTEESGA